MKDGIYKRPVIIGVYDDQTIIGECLLEVKDNNVSIKHIPFNLNI